MKFHRTAPGQDNDPLLSLLNEDETDRWFRPDGLTPWAVNTLIGQAYQEIAGASGPTSALLSGAAADARDARMAARAEAVQNAATPLRPTATDRSHETTAPDVRRGDGSAEAA